MWQNVKKFKFTFRLWLFTRFLSDKTYFENEKGKLFHINIGIKFEMQKCTVK